LEKKITGTIPAFALGPGKTKKNLCRDKKQLGYILAKIITNFFTGQPLFYFFVVNKYSS
jgi:ribosomal protein L25 (general stress protein Ctc)